jgi:hypothetical protein
MNQRALAGRYQPNELKIVLIPLTEEFSALKCLRTLQPVKMVKKKKKLKVITWN